MRRGVIARLLLGVIWLYRKGISPLLPPLCRFHPTCSRYAVDAIEQYGAASGGWLAFKRILRCRPGGGNGYDPVPVLDADAPSTAVGEDADEPPTTI